MRNKDGMRYPSIDDLLKQIDSKYKLAYTAAKTAKIIERHDIQIEDAKCVKSVGQALEEIIAGNVDIEFE
ncbi:MAG TPA: DNA-directed RNA polymerase subunit omega [Acholeplasmataceae bacterium]|jgi:DNA-directed RNA polymerase subunit omega|nr:DNA-directed RNA polymerase subunit omega [Acholeplasmataceae bacterium]HQC30131.1 DNA-directed RNA polymerase subunit omega [Acholeplasmataceae bacterium]